MKSSLVVLAVLSASVALAEKQPFERYQSIVDRQMFGPLPPGFDPTKSPNDVQKSSSKGDVELTKDQEQLKSAIRFSVIDVKSDGSVAVGFTDSSDPKAPKNYYLKVGEARDGWEVKAADPEAATMTIAKGEVSVSLSLGGNSASGGGTAAATASAANGLARRPGLLGGGAFGAKTLRERRLQRQQEAQAKLQEAQAAKEAERQALAEQDKQQREAERAEQRQQLLAIQEELKKVREARAAKENEPEGGNAQNDTE